MIKPRRSKFFPYHRRTSVRRGVEMMIIYSSFNQGGIQQLRGQEEGEGGSAKSPCLSTQDLNVHVDQNLKKNPAILESF